jgi:hypothetical protein
MIELGPPALEVLAPGDPSASVRGSHEPEYGEYDGHNQSRWTANPAPNNGRTRDNASTSNMHSDFPSGTSAAGSVVGTRAPVCSGMRRVGAKRTTGRNSQVE